MTKAKTKQPPDELEARLNARIKMYRKLEARMLRLDAALEKIADLLTKEPADADAARVFLRHQLAGAIRTATQALGRRS